MVLRKNEKASKREALVIEALAGIKSGKYKSGFDAARQLEINASTVNRRRRGHLSRSTARIQQQLLSAEEERTIIKWIQQVSQSGYPVSYNLLRQIVFEVRSCRVASSTPKHNFVEEKPIGRDWIPRFIQRHLDIKSAVGRRIETNRMAAITKETLNAWFDAVEQTVVKFNIDQRNIYNMDETGFAIGTMQSTRVIVDATIRTQWQANPGRQEWLTVVECICADGTVIKPFVIFKGENVDSRWIPGSLSENWAFAANTKGWTSNMHGFEWLNRVFDPLTQEKANGATRLLICDGHDSHISGSFIAHCMKNNIQLLVLPPHTSHILQPLDVALFGPLKKALTKALSPFHEARLKRIQKAEWLEAYVRARKMSITTLNIAAAWRGAGLVPFDRKKAIRYLPAEQTVNKPILTTPSGSPNNKRFKAVYINSSSPELGELQNANKMFEECIQNLETPARVHFRAIADRSERRSARHAIVEHELANVREVLNNRRDVKKGKRSIIKGKFILTLEEIRDGVLNAEIATSEAKKKVGQKCSKKATELAETTSEDGDGPEEPLELGIKDCIIIAMK